MGRTTKEAYQYICKSAEEFIYSSNWDGSMKQIKLQAVKIAADATQYDTDLKHNLYKIALTTLERFAQDRNAFEYECQLLWEQREIGCECDGREYSDYGINIYKNEVVQYD